MNDLKLVPSVFFSWLPASRQNSDWSASFSAGLGVKQDTPAVLAGLSVTYNWNIGIFLGAMIAQETRLLGKYTVGQAITEDLTNEQLTQKVYGPRPVVAVTFRFWSNPFSEPGAGATSANTKK